MPLFAVSPNVKAQQITVRKGTDNKLIDVSVDSLNCETLSTEKSCTMSTSTVESRPQSSSTPLVKMESSPRSSASALINADSSPSTRPSSSPTATLPESLSSQPPSDNSAQQQDVAKPLVPASKRKRNVTTEAKEKERAEKKQKQDDAATEKAKIAAEREAMKTAKAAEKATRAAEKARAEAEKEALRAAKAAEKAKADAEKEAKRQKKQEEELAAQAKKEKQQNLMASFLKKAPVTPSKTIDHPVPAAKVDAPNPSSKQESQPSKSAYELNFKPFFVKPGVTVAAPPFQMDDETKEAKSTILDEYVSGKRDEFTPDRPFNAAEVFQFAFPQQRGIITPSVKKIMESIHGDEYQNAFGITNVKSESQAEKLFSSAQDQLNTIPMKYIRFYEDVRPAYFGTITTPMTYPKLRTLSRRPAGRILPLAYDYDSEAEWVEDDGEDLDDAEDEEEDPDGDEEMDDFVDDSEAVSTIIRPGFVADSMPVSTGLCFENQQGSSPSATVSKYRLEFLLDSPEHHSTINPFSTEYWPAPIKKAAVTTTPLPAKGTILSMLPPTIPRDAGTTVTGTAPASDVKDGVPQDILEDFKRALLSDECKDYSKGTVVEILAKKFTSCTKAQVKSTLDTIAHRVTPAQATKRSVKIWALLPNFSLKQT
ncbi:chromatin assembly factor 1 subunit A-domain-containing protein [Nemania sp. NC0429]|nr:chromatin assembly factor 1 subunit A-domain-containing protein [Nemania sp. NC0429]